MAMYHSCEGEWEKLATGTQVDSNETHNFVNYAAMFLSNIGNYFVSYDLRVCLDLDLSNSCRDPGIRNSFLAFPRTAL